MAHHAQDNTEYISFDAGGTSIWVWGCFVAIILVMLAMLWEIRFPVVVKTDMVLTNDGYRAKRSYFLKISPSEDAARYIRAGQVVQLRLDDYPFEKYGYVKGTLTKVGVRQNKEITLGVDLPDGLTTTRKRVINDSDVVGLKGNAVIITENVRLLSRLYSSMNIFK